MRNTQGFPPDPIDLLGIDYFLESAGQAIRLYAG